MWRRIPHQRPQIKDTIMGKGNNSQKNDKKDKKPSKKAAAKAAGKK